MESLRNWVGNYLGTFSPSYEFRIKEEAQMMQEIVLDADKLKAQAYTDTSIFHGTPNFNTRLTAVDIAEREGRFIPNWKAIYLEKHGKLARVAYQQHVECDRETYFTRQRASLQNAETSASSSAAQ